MIKMVYPEQKPRIQSKAGKDFIFCMIRKKWLVLTPEEWVRQNLLLSLTQHLHYPASLIAVEKKLQFHEITKRFDIVVYDKLAKPFMLIECKEMNVPLAPNVLDQALRYNAQLQAPYFLISNGIDCIGFQKTDTGLAEIHTLPVFNNSLDL